jgi:hypothetical protein
MKQTGLVLVMVFLTQHVVFGQSTAVDGSGVTLHAPFGASAALPDTSRRFSDPAMQAKYDTIKAYMRLPSPLKFGDQYLALLGDQAAFFLFVYITLDILHKAFAKPKFIQDAGHRKPDGSLALLKLLQASAINEDVKERIVIETNFLLAIPQYIAPEVMVAPGPPPEPGTTPFR